MQDFQDKPAFKRGETQRLSLDADEYQKELRLMQDTHLLITNLTEREKATVKAILDSLYEVGSVRLINKKVNAKLLRGPLKGIAHFSKPMFQLFAWRWFKRNCPELITTWLYRQVRFGEQSLLAEVVENEIEPIDVLPSPELPPVKADLTEPAPAIAPIIEKQAAEILALRGRITLLTSMLAVLLLVVCLNLLA